jgi:hypothetical protein
MIPQWAKKAPKMSDYKRIDHVHLQLEEFFKLGFKVFNIYHFRKTDELLIQLKDGEGNSESLKFKCTYPIYRFPTTQMTLEKNIFKALYYIETARCTQHYVTSEIINLVGKIDVDNDTLKGLFNPEKYLIYNALRPEYYVSTKLTSEQNLTFEKTRIGSLDIETASDGGQFPAPNKAEYPIGMLTVFDFNSLCANVFYLTTHDIDDSLDKIWTKIREHLPEDVLGEVNFTINLMPFDDEKVLIETLISFLNENYDVIIGWNLNEFDIAYIVNRAKKKFNLSLSFGVVYDGFSPAYVFEHFVCIDYISVYKFFVAKNPPSLKLTDIAKNVIGIAKIQSETFLDIAYNITDSLLLFLMDKKLNLINQMFSFKENGAVLHVFNVRNALEPLIIKNGASSNGVFIANQYTIYYNIYYNEVYKFVNRDVLKLSKPECKIHETRNITTFLTNLSRHKSLLEFYMSSDDKDTEKKEETKEDSAGVILSKMVEKLFKKKSNRKKKEEAPINISELACKKNFDYESDDFNDILLKLYGINIDTIYGYPGAFNKSFRGVSGDIIDLDFFSMYPVIIYGLNISIETGKFLAPMKLCILKVYDRELYEKYVDESPDHAPIVYNLRTDKFNKYPLDQLDSTVFGETSIIANSGMIFNKTVGFIPKMCAYFLEVRTKYKDMMKTEEDPVMKGKYNIYQLLYKVYNNSIYGYLGYKYSVLFNRLLVASVTIMGRSEILFANYKINEHLGEKDNIKHAESTMGNDDKRNIADRETTVDEEGTD